MPNPENLIRPLKGEVRNPKGRTKGSKNLAYWISMLMNDEAFETNLIDPKKGIIEYKGAPIKAIIHAAIHRSLHDEKNGVKWAEWLARYGYGMAVKLQGDTDKPIQVVHIYKPEKLSSQDFNAEGEEIRQRAKIAVEAEVSDMESSARSTDLGVTST